MILVSYGITKSGSTLAFELVKGVLAAAGHPQPRLPDGVVEPGHKVNFAVFSRDTVAAVDRLLAAAPGDRIIAVKTHSGFEPGARSYLSALIEAGRLKVQVVHRDPRDICLSMLDAGRDARARGRQAFSEIVSPADAMTAASNQLEKLRMWRELPGVLELEYEELGFSPEAAIDRIAAALHVATDRRAAHDHAFRRAFTQKNLAVRRRHLVERDRALVSAFAERFAPLIRERNYDT